MNVSRAAFLAVAAYGSTCARHADFLNNLAGQAAIAIANAQLFDGLQRANIELRLAYDATIEGWSRAMDLLDEETEGHTHQTGQTDE